MGLSWAYVPGDAFSASTFINMWGQYIKGHVPQPNNPEYPLSTPREPFSLKRVGDCWLTTNNCKMKTHSFYFNCKTARQHNIKHLRSSPAGEDLTFRSHVCDNMEIFVQDQGRFRAKNRDYLLNDFLQL